MVHGLLGALISRAPQCAQRVIHDLDHTHSFINFVGAGVGRAASAAKPTAGR